jgi:hypothetical protein
MANKRVLHQIPGRNQAAIRGVNGLEGSVGLSPLAASASIPLTGDTLESDTPAAPRYTYRERVDAGMSEANAELIVVKYGMPEFFTANYAIIVEEEEAPDEDDDWSVVDGESTFTVSVVNAAGEVVERVEGVWGDSAWDAYGATKESLSAQVRQEIVAAEGASLGPVLSPISRAAVSRLVRPGDKWDVKASYSEYVVNGNLGTTVFPAKNVVETRKVLAVNTERIKWSREDGTTITTSLNSPGDGLFLDDRGVFVVRYDNGTELVFERT